MYTGRQKFLYTYKLYAFWRFRQCSETHPSRCICKSISAGQCTTNSRNEGIVRDVFYMNEELERLYCAHLLSSSRSDSRKRDASYRAHVHLAPSIHMSCGEWESECSGRGVETTESGAVAACQVGEALCRPRAALGSNYSERSIFACRFHASRVGVQSAVIYGRKLDKRAWAPHDRSADDFCESSLFQADGARLSTTVNSAPEPRQLAGEEISPRDLR